MECMICYNEMCTWDTYNMPGCTHSICIVCADRMQSNDNNSDNTYDLSDDDSIELSIDDDRLTFSGYSSAPYSEVPIDYTIKVSLDGYKITRVYYYDLEGNFDTIQCPYCRQHGPLWYDFDEIRYCVPSRISEWNTLEQKLIKDKVTSYSMKHGESTFAFKLTNNSRVLRIMWSEVNKCGFSKPVVRPEKKYIEPILSKRTKDSRIYNRKKMFMKMVR